MTSKSVSVNEKQAKKNAAAVKGLIGNHIIPPLQNGPVGKFLGSDQSDEKTAEPGPLTTILRTAKAAREKTKANIGEVSRDRYINQGAGGRLQEKETVVSGCLNPIQVFVPAPVPATVTLTKTEKSVKKLSEQEAKEMRLVGRTIKKGTVLYKALKSSFSGKAATVGIYEVLKVNFGIYGASSLRAKMLHDGDRTTTIEKYAVSRYFSTPREALRDALKSTQAQARSYDQYAATERKQAKAIQRGLKLLPPTKRIRNRSKNNSKR